MFYVEHLTETKMDEEEVEVEEVQEYAMRVYYEEDFTFWIEAKSREEAEKLAEQVMWDHVSAEIDGTYLGNCRTEPKSRNVTIDHEA
tara:strand:- start:24 stop:284 length:261 start_codon:yes stop_codon:yes gene_type:complete